MTAKKGGFLPDVMRDDVSSVAKPADLDEKTRELKVHVLHQMIWKSYWPKGEEPVFVFPEFSPQVIDKPKAMSFDFDAWFKRDGVWYIIDIENAQKRVLGFVIPPARYSSAATAAKVDVPPSSDETTGASCTSSSCMVVHSR